MISDTDGDKLRRIIEAARQLNQRLIDRIDDTGLIKPPLAIKSRVKSYESASEKITRKLTEDPTYSVSSVGDIIGLRIVALHNRDVPKVLHDVIKLFLPKNSHFAGPCEIKEVIQYRAFSQFIPNSESKGVHNPNEAELKKIISSFDSQGNIPKLRTEDRDYYSSVHVTVNVPLNAEEGSIKVPTEIQIRSIFEDAYSEIDHKIFYEVDRIHGFDTKIRNAVSSELRV